MDVRTGLIVSAVPFLLWAGCAPHNTRDLELSYLSAVVPEDCLDISHLDVAGIEHVQIQEQAGRRYLGLMVSGNQARVHGGVRAEVSVDYPFQPGDTVEYSWQMMIPAEFVTDAPQNRWWLIGQWHDQPDPSQGETWDNFESRSPPVLIALGELHGQLGLGVSCGPTTNSQPQRTWGPVALERGSWHTLRVRIHWSQQDDGRIDLFLDEGTDPVVSDRGPNLNNAYQHYFKFGMYRHPEISSTNWIYVDELHIQRL